MHDIFLSYSSQDRERLFPLVDALEAQGWSVFWDHRAIKVADDWHEVIGTAIQECTCVIVVWSENSVLSKWVKEEALIAKDRGVIYPILLDQIVMPFGFNLIQAANFIDWNGEADQSEFVGLKEQLSIHLDLQPVANLEPISLRPFSREITPVLIPEAQPKPELKPESKPKPERKAADRQAIPHNAVEIPAKSEKSQSKVKLVGGLLVLVAVCVGGFQLIQIKTQSSNQTTTKINTIQATPVSEPVEVLKTAVIVEPKMVLIPEGSFMMGCDDQKESDCQSDEKPSHEVNIAKFYLAKTEVTVAQFRAFVEDKNYKTTAEQQGSCYSFDENGEWGDIEGNSWKKLGFEQADNHPVTCVSHNDAAAYVRWLEDKTGKDWRLPSEAEWEYAARARSTTAYPWGNEIGKNKANCWNSECGDKFSKTSPVKSFPSNKWGLYDMHGNVWEWIEDKWHGNYTGAPNDGTAWVSGGDFNRVLRSGAWNRFSERLRSANRDDSSPLNRSARIGFRPAQNYGQ